MGFNPRTRVGCDFLRQLELAVHIIVSIHAPAWGATSTANSRHHSREVSIHAPAWGATLLHGRAAMGQ